MQCGLYLVYSIFCQSILDCYLLCQVNTTTKESCKKKSKKRKYCEENLLPADATADGEANAKKQMRKSRSDSFLLELEQSNELVEDCDDNEYKKKKKKSKKRKSKEL